MKDNLPPAFAALADRLEGAWPIDDAATRHMLRIHGVEIAHVRPRGDDTFDFDETRSGPLACWVADGDRHDQVIAWKPDRPNKLRYLDGDRPPYIGRWHLESRSTRRRPVELFDDLEAWLAAGRDGLLIVDWERFDAHSELAGIPAALCPSEAVKQRLERAFKPRIKITVRELADIRHAA
jgi:hypothetical protein